VNDGGGQGQLLLHAVGKIGDELFVLVGQLHEFEQFLGAKVGGLLIQAVHAADKSKIFRGGEAAEESHAFRYNADLALELESRCTEGLAKNLNGFRRWARASR